MKNYAIGFKMLSKGASDTHKVTGYATAKTRFQALLNFARRVDLYNRNINSIDYVVNLSGPADQ